MRRSTVSPRTFILISSVFVTANLAVTTSASALCSTTRSMREHVERQGPGGPYWGDLPGLRNKEREECGGDDHVRPAVRPATTPTPTPTPRPTPTPQVRRECPPLTNMCFTPGENPNRFAQGTDSWARLMCKTTDRDGNRIHTGYANERDCITAVRTYADTRWQRHGEVEITERERATRTQPNIGSSGGASSAQTPPVVEQAGRTPESCVSAVNVNNPVPVRQCQGVGNHGRDWQITATNSCQCTAYGHIRWTGTDVANKPILNGYFTLVVKPGGFANERFTSCSEVNAPVTIVIQRYDCPSR